MQPQNPNTQTPPQLPQQPLQPPTAPPQPQQPLQQPPLPSTPPQPAPEPAPPQQPIMTSQKPRSKVRSFLSFVGFIVGVLIAAFLINQFIFQSYFVDGTSMTPTLQNNDRLIIEKVSRSFSLLTGKDYIPNRGQIVVLDSSLTNANGQEEQLIKRVIGLPGDTVIVDNGVVTVKNAQNPEGFDANQKLGLSLQPTYAESRIEVAIPEGSVYVMGDNRVQNGSYDSRAFGPVQASKLEGRLWARVLPFNVAQLFSTSPGWRNFAL